MSDMVNYVITIKSDGELETSAPQKSIAKTPGGMDLSPGRRNDSAIISKTAAWGYAKQATDMYITTSLNVVEIQTGNSRQAELWEYQYSKAKTYGLAAITGLATDGPGGVLKALTLVSVGNMIQNTINAYQLKIQREVESVGIRMQNLRSGTSGDRAIKRY